MVQVLTQTRDETRQTGANPRSGSPGRCADLLRGQTGQIAHREQATVSRIETHQGGGEIESIG